MDIKIVFLLLQGLCVYHTHAISCREECNNIYGEVVGGRIATSNDKGRYGYNNPNCQCTCVFPPISNISSQRKCQKKCGDDQPSYCYYMNVLGCIKNKGIKCR